jgi:glycosyltransferase involved in cell wall biosynthesis
VAHSNRQRTSALRRAIVEALLRRNTSCHEVDLAVACYFNPADVLGGAEQIAWAEAELLLPTQRVVFLSASAPVADSPVTQVRLGGWTRALYQPAGTRRNAVKLALFHLLSLFNPGVFFESLILFRRLRPAVVHTHNLIALSPALWLSARLSGAKVVHTHHDLWLRCERATMTDAEGRPCNDSQPTCRLCHLLRRPKELQLGLVTTEVFPSNWLRGRLGRAGAVIPGFSTSGIAKDRAPVPSSPAIVSYIGALTPHKLGPLLEAFSLTSTESAKSVTLAIAGAGPLEDRVLAASREDPRISFLHQIDSQARDLLLRRTSVVVIPSTCAESCSLVFFEALAAGVAVIASDIGGITELQRYGNAILVPPGDADALADALNTLLAHHERIAELNAAAWVHRGAASPERFVEQIERVIAALGVGAPTG